MTSREFAKLLGISQSTVSRALNGSPLVSPETKGYILKKADECGFVLNSQARSLKMKKTGSIGILFPKFWESLSKNLMFTYIYDTILKELNRLNYDALVICSSDTIGLSTLERIVKSRKVDGFVNLRSTLSAEELYLIQKYNAPCVSVFQPLQSVQLLCQYCADEYNAGFQAGQYYGQHKEYMPIYISLPLTESSSRPRYDGFAAGLNQAGLKPERVLECELSSQSAYAVTLQNKEFFLSKRTASFVYNDMLALGVVRALQSLNVAIPEDAQIIGLDDIPMDTWFPPALSTLHTPVHDLVEDACLALKQMLDGEKRAIEYKLYTPQLIHRETTLG